MLLEYSKRWLQKLDEPIENLADPKNLMRNMMSIELVKVTLMLLWSTYMYDDYYSYIEQAQTLRDGNLNYSAISGRSGPVAYPALSSYLHVLFLDKYITDDGQYYFMARVICSIVHLITMYFVVRVYQLTFSNKPQLGNLVLLQWFSFISVQAYSEKIFNDSYVVLFTVLALYLFQTQCMFFACISVSLAIGFKANALIFLPAVYLITSRARGIWIGTLYMVIIFALQVLYAYPFLSTYPYEYLKGSYNVGRLYSHGHSFFWKFLIPQIVHNQLFNLSLLTIQLSILIYFLFSRWLKFQQWFKLLGVWPLRIWPKFQVQDPHYIGEVFMVTNFIGLMCARGMFFQYFQWFWFSVPFILWYGPMKFHKYTVKELLYFMCFFDFILTLGAYGAQKYPGSIAQHFIFIWITYKVIASVSLKTDSSYSVVLDETTKPRI